MRKALGVVVAVALALTGVGVGAGRTWAAGCSTSMAPLQDLAGCILNKTTIASPLEDANSILRATNLNHATVSGLAALLGSDLTGANLNGATISGSDALTNGLLAGANVRPGRLLRCHLVPPDLPRRHELRQRRRYLRRAPERPAPAVSAGVVAGSPTPVPLSKLNLASSDVTWNAGATAGGHLRTRTVPVPPVRPGALIRARCRSRVTVAVMR